MREDLSGPYPGFGLGALNPFHGYVIYRLHYSPPVLGRELEDPLGGCSVLQPDPNLKPRTRRAPEQAIESHLCLAACGK